KLCRQLCRNGRNLRACPKSSGSEPLSQPLSKPLSNWPVFDKGCDKGVVLGQALFKARMRTCLSVTLVFSPEFFPGKWSRTLAKPGKIPEAVPVNFLLLRGL